MFTQRRKNRIKIREGGLHHHYIALFTFPDIESAQAASQEIKRLPIPRSFKAACDACHQHGGVSKIF